MIDFKRINIDVCFLGEYDGLSDFVKCNNLEEKFKNDYGHNINEEEFEDMSEDEFVTEMLNKYFDTDTKRYYTTLEDNNNYFRIDYIEMSEKESDYE